MSLRSRIARCGGGWAVACGLVLMASGTAAAQDDEPTSSVSVSANAGWVSQYYFRGILQKTSSASAGLDLSAGPVSVGTWAADVGDGSEVDLYGSVGFAAGDFSASVGGTAYLYTGAFDDTYREANFSAGYGPVGVDFAIGDYLNFGDEKQNYWFLALNVEQSGFFGTFGTFGNDFDGQYAEVGYGFSAADLDFSISGLVNDKTISGHHDSAGEPRVGFTLIFGVSKSFTLK